MTPQEEQKYENRFDRIENKLDKLVEIVTSLARVEEQMASSQKRMDHIESRVDKIERDVGQVADIARANGVVAKFADKLFWVIIVALIGVASYAVKSGL